MMDVEQSSLSKKESSSKPQELLERFQLTRKHTHSICRTLTIEDQSVQPALEISPPKWHLGHTSWFFEEMILKKELPQYSEWNTFHNLIFNSYYKSAGRHWLQQERGHLSRPTVREILDYRDHIDYNIAKLLLESNANAEVKFLVELGIQHEKQHQELLLMDIKYILGMNPMRPKYEKSKRPKSLCSHQKWIEFSEDIYEIGHEGSSFAFDNEEPRHKTYIHNYKISDCLVTNREYLEFIHSGGYQDPRHWLSQGWDWINKFNIQCPLYWFKKDNSWFEYTLYGVEVLDPNPPLVHISYFEADAFANWAGYRLPTEQESEIFLTTYSEGLRSLSPHALHPSRSDLATGQVWWWTSSHYSPYPGFKPFQGSLGEYNGKFMCNQFVLKGGSIATPQDHYRHSYRNFFQAQQRWMFSGIRLAKDKP